MCACSVSGLQLSAGSFLLERQGQFCLWGVGDYSEPRASITIIPLSPAHAHTYAHKQTRTPLKQRTHAPAPTLPRSLAPTGRSAQDEEREFRLLRTYLTCNEIPQSLAQKVTRFLQHQFTLRIQAARPGEQVSAGPAPLLTLPGLNRFHWEGESCCAG